MLQAKNDQGAREDKKKQKKNKQTKQNKNKKKRKRRISGMALIVTLTKQSPPEESVDSCMMYTVGNRVIDIPSILSERQGLWPVSRKSRNVLGPKSRS